MVRVLTSQWEFTRLSSIKFSCSLVRDVVPTVILYDFHFRHNENRAIMTRLTFRFSKNFQREILKAIISLLLHAFFLIRTSIFDLRLGVLIFYAF